MCKCVNGRIPRSKTVREADALAGARPKAESVVLLGYDDKSAHPRVPARAAIAGRGVGRAADASSASNAAKKAAKRKYDVFMCRSSPVRR